MKTQRAAPRRRRQGYALLDVTVALFVAVTAMTVTVKVLGWMAAERRAGDRRQWASQEAANVLERAVAGPYDALTAERVRALASAAKAETVLPGAAWDVEVADDPAAPRPARRVSLRLRWRDRSGGWGAPVRLSAWVFRAGGSS